MLRFNTKFTVKPSVLVKLNVSVVTEVVFPRTRPSNDGSNATATVLLADELTTVGVSATLTNVGTGPRRAVEMTPLAVSVL